MARRGNPERSHGNCRFLALCALALVAFTGVAREANAGGSTLAVGARARGFQPALVGEFWIGRLGLSAEAGIGFYESEQTLRSQEGSDALRKDNGSSLQAGAAMYYVLARGTRSQLSSGLRFGYGRSHDSFDEGRSGKRINTYTEFTVPVRFELWIVKRVSVYAELGMGVRDSKTENIGDNQFGGVASRSRQLITFGDPVGNAGVSFHF